MAAPRGTLAARARLRALVRLPRRRDAPVRADALPRQPLRCSRRARPTTATTSPRTSPTTRSSTSATCAAVDAEQPFFLYFATGACHSPHHAPPEWIERYRGQFDDGLGRVARARRSPASSRARARCPPDTELSPRPPWVPAWDDARARRPARSRRASWSASPAFLSHTDDADRPRARRSSSELGELDNTHRRRSCPTTARASEGGATRLDQRRAPRGTARPPAAASCATRIDELGGPTAAQQLPVGLDDGRQHAVPALEARGARGRRRRSVHRALAARHRRRRGERPPPVRARDRRAARPARAHRHRRARPRSTASAQSPDRRHELRVRCSTTPTRPSSHDHAVLRDARLPRRSTTTAGRR